jgi:hypothetical protein
LQERPLDALGATEAFRGLYSHSLGVTVLVRVVQVNGDAILVAKVIERGPGPLGWITTRRLSDAEWLELRRAAAALPEGSHEYFSPPKVETGPRDTAERCYTHDGAVVRVERFEAGVLHIAGGKYEAPGDTPCSGRVCCDPKSEALSRFFDELKDLVECDEPKEQ